MIKQLFGKNLKFISRSIGFGFTFLFYLLVINSCRSIPFTFKSKNSDFNDYLFKRYSNSDFEYFSCEQVDLTLLDSENRRIKAKVYVHKGEYIFASIFFMGIELGRAEFTSDSIKILNRFSKTFYFSDLETFNSKLNFNFTYEQLELLLLKGVLVNKDENRRKFSSHVNEIKDFYVFNFINEDSLVVRSIFDKQSYNESKIEVYNENLLEFNLEVNIRAFNKSGTYPEEMNVYLKRDGDSKNIEIKLGEILNKKLENRSFIVNSKYREMEF